jgi:hypothetical protein
MAWASADLGNQRPCSVASICSPASESRIPGRNVAQNPVLREIWSVGKAWHSHNIDDRLIMANGYKYPGLL